MELTAGLRPGWMLHRVFGKEIMKILGGQLSPFWQRTMLGRAIDGTDRFRVDRAIYDACFNTRAPRPARRLAPKG